MAEEIKGEKLSAGGIRISTSEGRPFDNGDYITIRVFRGLLP